ncbi:MAG: DUF2997 domain-containing protein [Deltaproteobacteria bacterium]|nr:DUF2997 domain-containing protein [Deltaproteobacteria bacterium]
MSKVEVTIHENGQVDLNLSDFYDNSCLDVTRTIEHLLGNQIINRNYLRSRLSETITPREEKQLNQAG